MWRKSVCRSVFRHFCSHHHHHSFIIINSNNIQQVIIVLKGRNTILCGRNRNCANIAIKEELSKTAIFSLHNRIRVFSQYIAMGPQTEHNLSFKQSTLFSTFLTRSGLPPLCQNQIWTILGFYRERHVKGRGPVETSRRGEFEQKSKLIFSSWEGRGKTSLSCPSNLFIRCQICEDLDRFHQIWSALCSRLLTYIPLSLNQ